MQIIVLSLFVSKFLSTMFIFTNLVNNYNINVFIKTYVDNIETYTFCITDWYFYKYVKFEMKRNRYNLVHMDGVLCIHVFTNKRSLHVFWQTGVSKHSYFHIVSRNQCSRFRNYFWVASIQERTLKMVSSNNQDGLCMSITLYIRYSRNWFTAISSGLNSDVKTSEGFVYGYQLMHEMINTCEQAKPHCVFSHLGCNIHVCVGTGQSILILIII